MAERFNGRVESEMLGITIPFHRDLDPLLRGFNAAYNARRQRVLGGRTPNQVVAERLATRRRLRSTKPSGQAGTEDVAKARLIIESAKEVSQPDSLGRISQAAKRAYQSNAETILARCQGVGEGRCQKGVALWTCQAWARHDAQAAHDEWRVA